MAVGVALAKPWERPNAPSLAAVVATFSVDSSAGATVPDVTSEPIARLEPQPTPPPAQAQGPSSTPGWPSLAIATSRLSAVEATSNTGWLVAQWQPDPVEIGFVASIPRTASLGSACSGGFMFYEGTDAVALVLPTRSTAGGPRQITLRRLFAKGTPLSVPFSLELDDKGGIALVKSEQAEWDPGDYALTIDRGGDARSFVFCVGRSYRMVDYKLLTIVPPGVDARGARIETLHK